MERAADALYALSRQILGETDAPIRDYDRTIMRAVERITLSGLTSTTGGLLSFAERDTINVKAFPYLAKGDGVSNDTTAVQAAIAAVPSIGGVVIFPPGTYRITASLVLTSKLVLLGAGPTLSVIQGNGVMSLLLRFTSTDGASLSDVTIRDLGFDLHGYNTTDFAYGIAINTAIVRRIRIHGNRFFDSNYPGDATVKQREWILVLPAEDCWITENDLAHGGRIHVGCGSGGTPTRNVWICGNKIDFVNDNAITVLQAGTAAVPFGTVTEKLYILDNTILDAQGVGIAVGMDGQSYDDPTATLKDVHIARNVVWTMTVGGDGISCAIPSGANACEHILIEDNIVRKHGTDGSSWAGIQVTQADNPVGVARWFTIRGNHVSHDAVTANYLGITVVAQGGIADLSIEANLIAKGNEGIHVASAGTFARLAILNNRLLDQNGAQIAISGNAVIANGRIEGNWCAGQAGVNASNAALSIASSTTAANYEFTIRNNAFINSASKGIRLTSSVLPTSGGFLLYLLDNDLTGNVAAIDVQSSAAYATGSQRRRNRGFLTEASGTGTINSGATTATITHGLAVTPTAKDLTIGFTENPTNDPGNWWVSGLTATQFVLNVRNDPGASHLDFTWQAAVL